MSNWDRQASGFRFGGLGIKTNAAPDALPSNRSPYLQNMRAYTDSELQSRPPMSQITAAPGVGAGPVLSLNASTGLYKIGSNVYYAGTAIDPSIYSTNPAAILPFRPNASPDTWAYVFDQAVARKINTPTAYDIGTPEPQLAVDAGVYDMLFSSIAPSWTAGGTAGAITTGTRVGPDPVGAIFYDEANPLLQTLYLGTVAPASGGVTGYAIVSGGTYLAEVGGVGTTFTPTVSGGGGTGCTVSLNFRITQTSPQVEMTLSSITITDPGTGYTSAPTLTITGSPSGAITTPAVVNLYIGGSPASDIKNYSRFMWVTPSSTNSPCMVQDVFQPIAGPIGIQSIFYYSGTTGKCIVVPQNMGSEGEGVSESIYGPTLLNSLRRGALVQIGTETCMVLSVTRGPNNTICFETSTTSNHTNSEQLTGVPAIQIAGTANVGDNVTGNAYNSSITAGIGTATATLGANVFLANNTPFQSEDYMHLSVLADHIENINEIKFLLDCGDGSFTQNFYYYTIRPSDIQAGIQNTLTQLGVAQIVSQRETIDEERAAMARNQGQTASSSQSVPGELQWSEIVFPLSALTRVGGDQTKSLQTVTKVQVLVNANATVGFDWGAISVFGGNQPDVSFTGLPVRYVIRPRSSATGTKGNPSPEMRYGISARRQKIQVLLPAAPTDSQIDTWDIFRMGGALDHYVYVGSVPTSQTAYYDNYNDADLMDSPGLERNLFQPFPTVGPPIKASMTSYGTIINLSVDTPYTNLPNDIGRYLPGNIINIGDTTYTLRSRPITLASNSYQFEVVENAGYQTSMWLYVYEPKIAKSPTSYVWGPDSNGRMFAVGDTYRPGFVSTTNPSDPDSSGDDAAEICPPSEPLQMGALLGMTPVVASASRWWRGFPTQSGSYNWNEIPVGEGVEFPWAVCSDGQYVYFLTAHGISRHAGGASESLTDADLYNLFPHEDVYPSAVTYNGKTITPPGYQYGSQFRLSTKGGFLFFDYVDINNAQQTLVMNTKTKNWVSKDVYADSITVRDVITRPPNVSGGKPEQQMLCGSVSGAIYAENSTPTPGLGEVVSCIVATPEEMQGDLRAPKLYGDAVVDAEAAGNITATPMFFGNPYISPTTIVTGGRALAIVSVGGEYLARSMGLYLSWVDQGAITSLYLWQVSYIIKPEFTQNRFEDWNTSGTPGNKFYQGFLLMADTQNAAKTLTIRDADTLSTHSFTGPQLTSNEILHNGQSELAYSFDTPFLAHSVRFEPDSTDWQFYTIRYIWQPSPEFVKTWKTQATSFGINGYMHMQRILLPYAATAPVTFTITVDGRSYSYTLPSTGGAYQKQEIILGPLLKGMVYTFSATSTALFAIWQDDVEILVKGWGDTGDYRRIKNMGAPMGNEAQI